MENRLVVVTNTVSGDVTRFVYDGDGDGQRVLRVDGRGTTVYVGKERITYLHRDHLGSASLATDASGGASERNTHRPVAHG